jgi:hypothetical protein
MLSHLCSLYCDIVSIHAIKHVLHAFCTAIAFYITCRAALYEIAWLFTQFISEGRDVKKKCAYFWFKIVHVCTCHGASIAEWLWLLTSNHLPLTTVNTYEKNLHLVCHLFVSISFVKLKFWLQVWCVNHLAMP